MVVESNAALAGVILEVSLGRSRVSMAAFNKGRAAAHPFNRWDSVVIVGIQGSCCVAWMP